VSESRAGKSCRIRVHAGVDCNGHARNQDKGLTRVMELKNAQKPGMFSTFINKADFSAVFE
jgi:hypothetical protein